MMFEGKPVSAARRISGVVSLTVAMAKKTFSRLVRPGEALARLAGLACF